MDTFAIPEVQEMRYDRHHAIEWWNQDRLKNSNILVAGAGAIGNEVRRVLALAGVKEFIICDHDLVSISNLSRCSLFREEDVNQQ